AVRRSDSPFGLRPPVAAGPETVTPPGRPPPRGGDFLYEPRLFPEPEYTFKHALTHEVAYGSLLLERRRGLHACLVAAIEALAPARGIEVTAGAQGLSAGRQDPHQVERLAHHALRGEVWDKAVAYCQKAGVRAYDRAAF